jgi:hypothetical protein
LLAEIGDTMSRYLSLALLALLLAACSEEARDSSFVSEAVAAPAKAAPDYGWRTDMSPTAVPDGTVKDYE